MGWQAIHHSSLGTHGINLQVGAFLPGSYLWLVASRRCSNFGGIVCVNGDDLCTQGFFFLLLSDAELLSAQISLVGVLLLLRHLFQEWRCLDAFANAVRPQWWIQDIRMKAEVRAW